MPGERQGIEHEPKANPHCLIEKMKVTILFKDSKLATKETESLYRIYEEAFEMLTDLKMDTTKTCPDSVFLAFTKALKDATKPQHIISGGVPLIDYGKVLSAVASVHAMLR